MIQREEHLEPRTISIPRPTPASIAPRRSAGGPTSRFAALIDTPNAVNRKGRHGSPPSLFERLLNFLRRKGRSHEDAEDLIQEAMLRLHVYAREEPVVNEEAFLRPRGAESFHRPTPPRPHDLRREVSLEDVDTSRSLRPQATPENTLEAEQRLTASSAILDAASRRTREIYFAHRAGYSYAEIAGTLAYFAHHHPPPYRPRALGDHGTAAS